MKKLLLNYIYYNPVGHVVEALRFTKGFKEANPDLEVYVALSKYSPTELTQACPWIKETYPVDIFKFLDNNDNIELLKDIPRDWDFMVKNNLIELEKEGASHLGKEEEAMIKYYKVADKYFVANEKGIMYPEMKLPEGLNYKLNTKINLELPQSSIDFAKKLDHNGPKFCILMAGSAGYSYYPAIETWIKIIEALNFNFPNSKIYLTGVRKSVDGRTDSGAYTEERIQSVLEKFENVVDCYDIGLWNQLGVIKQSDIFISPHTGFAFLAPCVDTPWLAISGGDWAEYFFNDIPFYSVLPDNPDYPYGGNLVDKYSNEGKIPCMDPENLDKKIPEVIEAAKLLLDKNFTYEKAIQRHKENIARANIKREKIPTGPDF